MCWADFFLWRNFRFGNTNLHNCHNFQMSVSYDEHQFENTFHNWITILSSTLVNFSSPVFGCMRMALCMLNFIRLSIFQRLSRKHTSIRVYLTQCLYTVVIQMWSKSAFDLYAIVSFNDALCHTIFVCWLKWNLCQSEGYRYCKSVVILLIQDSLTNSFQRIVVFIISKWISLDLSVFISVFLSLHQLELIEKWFMHYCRQNESTL